MAEVVEKALQYKKYLDKYIDKDYDESKILLVFKKLDKLPITLKVLQETRVGKSVNSFRKTEGDIGVKARALVLKWKELVAVNSSPPSVQCETVCETTYDGQNANSSGGSMKAPYMDSPEEKNSLRESVSRNMKKEMQEEEDESSQESSKWKRKRKAEEVYSSPVNVKKEKIDNSYGSLDEHQAMSARYNVKQEKYDDGYGSPCESSSSVTREVSERESDSEPHHRSKKSHKQDRKEKHHHSDRKKDQASSSHHHGDRKKDRVSSSKSHNVDDSHTNSKENGASHSDQDKSDKNTKSKTSSNNDRDKVRKEFRHKDVGQVSHHRDKGKDSSTHREGEKEHRQSKDRSDKHNCDNISKEKDSRVKKEGGKVQENQDSNQRDERASKDKDSSKNLKYKEGEKKHRSSRDRSNHSDVDKHKCDKDPKSKHEAKYNDSYQEHPRPSSKDRSHSNAVESSDSTDNHGKTEKDKHSSRNHSSSRQHGHSAKHSSSSHGDKSKHSSSRDESGSTSKNSDKNHESRLHSSKSSEKLKMIKSEDVALSTGNESALSSPSREKVKSGKRTMEMDGCDDEDGVDSNHDNGGLSFEDMLTMPTVVKKNKKRKTGSASTGSGTSPVPSVKVEKSSEDKKKSSKSSSSHSHKHKKHKSSHKHKSSSEDRHHRDKHRSRSSKGRDEVSDNNSPERLGIPPPPKQPVAISEADIMSTLPAISPNYKPLPHLDLDMMTDRQKALDSLDESEIGSKKNTRTAVYSGRKAISYLTEVPSLYDSCMRVLMDNIDALEFVGGVPFDILQPVLAKCTPQQLYALEDCNPQFIGESDELWEKHCKKDFRNKPREEFESWRELYIRLHDEREKRLKNLTASIKTGMRKAVPVRQTKLAYVDITAKAPRDVRRRQIKHGTAGPSGALDPLSKLSSHNTEGVSVPRAPIPRGESSLGQRSKEQKSVKPVAPMMAKTLRFMKKINRR